MARRNLGLMLSLLRGTFNNIEEDTDDDEQIMILLLEGRLSLRGFRVAPPRLEGFLDQIVPRYTLCQFRSHFRIAPATANELENRLAPLLVRAGVEGRLPIKPRTQILVCIWILANPDSYRSVEVQFGMGKSSLHHCFVRVIHSLCDIASEIICWPEGHNLNRIKEAFKAKAGMPDVIGAIDGSHIEIEAPKAHRDFNNILSRTRQVIEREFALLKGRFRRLKHLHMDLIHEIPYAILACCVLHNLCLQGFHEDERELEEYIRDGEEDNALYEEEQDLDEELLNNFDNNATPGQRKLHVSSKFTGYSTNFEYLIRSKCKHNTILMLF